MTIPVWALWAGAMLGVAIAMVGIVCILLANAMSDAG